MKPCLPITSPPPPPPPPPLRRLKRLREVPSVSPHLPITQLAYDHEVQYPTVAVVDDPLDNPQSLPDQHAAHLERRRRGGVGFLERPHVLPAPEALPGLGHLHHVVFWVARVVFLFGEVAGIQIGEELVRLLLVHLFEVGHSL